MLQMSLFAGQEYRCRHVDVDTVGKGRVRRTGRVGLTYIYSVV